jgi:uncharacterized protein with von Willebrand factor type A (vWA) domain
MMTMKSEDLPLFVLFQRLRDHGLVLGINEYTSLLEAMQSGFGISDRYTLAQLCHALWTTSPEEVKIFDRLFNEIIPYIPEPSKEPQPKATHKAFAEMPSSLPQPVKDSAEAATMLNESVQVVQAIRNQISRPSRYVLSSKNLVLEYLPVTQRQLKQNWRVLRRPIRQGPPAELDIAATIEKMSREGALIEPILLPQRRNLTEIVLFIDYDGSMVPFHSLSQLVVETAKRGSRLGDTNVYYFHDYPDSYVYHDVARLKAEAIDTVISEFNSYASIMIVSDGGAARGKYDIRRIHQTTSFLEKLQQAIQHIVWLNPVPSYRWGGTTAGEIQKIVPMFELDRKGIQMASQVLRGKYFG